MFSGFYKKFYAFWKTSEFIATVFTSMVFQPRNSCVFSDSLFSLSFFFFQHETYNSYNYWSGSSILQFSLVVNTQICMDNGNDNTTAGERPLFHS